MRRASLIIRVGRGTMRAEVTRSGTVVWAAESAFATEEDLVTALGALGQAPSVAGIRAARIELEAPLVQLRTLADLPPVRASALRALVAHQAGRYFRKNGKPLVTNAAWQRSSSGGSRTVLAAATEEPWVEAVLQGVRAAGIKPVGITPVGSSLELLPAGERVARGRASAGHAYRLAAIAAALWGLVGVLAAEQLIHGSAQVEQELAGLGPAAAAARQVRQEYDAAEAMIGALEGAARRRGTLASRAAAVLLSLPDSAYLTTLHVHDDATGEITGAARRPLDVVAALDRTRAVDGARLAGPSVRVPVGGRDYEAFTVRFGRDSAR